MAVGAKKLKDTHAPESKTGFSLISNDTLLRLYETMIKCRLLEKRTRTIQIDAKPTGSGRRAAKQEASLAGAALNLGAGDRILVSQGGPAVELVKRVPVAKIVARLPLSWKQSADLLKQAVDTARANKAKKNGKVVAVFSDANLPECPAFLDALKSGEAASLPILFVYRNNAPEPPGGKRSAKAAPRSTGAPSITVDANDVVAVYRVAFEAISRARQGCRPTVVECRPYRLQLPAKSGAAKPTRAKADDPIANMETYLTRKGLFTAGTKRKIAADFKVQLDGVIAATANLTAN